MIRLPDALLVFIDRRVDEGTPSRAAVIAAMLDRERRRALAEGDVALILADGEDDLDAAKGPTSHAKRASDGRIIGPSGDHTSSARGSACGDLGRPPKAHKGQKGSLTAWSV